ncbi:hypothetical protein GCN74_08735 [Janthinobacterium sp. FT14W]|uniref:hypothetical protein n=1 Tax=Janthinobacterium sp. FT14W TaxID=2654253 RepID=UPI001264C4B3|nr:hypothetical protein [Janthinobacterium sp. FT14W]KAB8060360.1 hypothetical protein GCN74_08735 [Janthinobacterium sp. FT14W]
MTIHNTLLATLFACSLAPLALAQTATTRQPGDPQRWYQEDSTAQAQLRTLRKEIAAALAEAKKACRSEPSATRTTCLRGAQDTYRQDMANAEKLREAAHPQ